MIVTVNDRPQPHFFYSSLFQQNDDNDHDNKYVPIIIHDQHNSKKNNDGIDFFTGSFDVVSGCSIIGDMFCRQQQRHGNNNETTNYFLFFFVDLDIIIFVSC